MTADLDTLQAEAEQANDRARQARADVTANLAEQGNERAERELEWRRRYLAEFDLATVQQDIADARAAVVEAIMTSDLGSALLRLATAERLGYSEKSFAANTATMAGVDPEVVVGYDPAIHTPNRTLTDVLKLLVDVVSDTAQATVRAHEAQRQAAFETAVSDHGRLTVAATHRDVIRCGACNRPIPPDAVHYSTHGLPFHDNPACKPRPQFPAATSLADEEASRLRLRKEGLI